MASDPCEDIIGDMVLEHLVLGGLLGYGLSVLHEDRRIESFRIIEVTIDKPIDDGILHGKLVVETLKLEIKLFWALDEILTHSLVLSLEFIFAYADTSIDI